MAAGPAVGVPHVMESAAVPLSEPYPSLGLGPLDASLTGYMPSGM